MSINGISIADQYTLNSKLSGLDQTQEASTDGESSTSVTKHKHRAKADEAGFSEMGKLMGQLAQLQQTDPDKFKTVTESISKDLASKAQTSTDSKQTQMLTDLSQKFDEASQTGDMSSLRPEPPKSGYHHQQQPSGTDAAEPTDGAKNFMSEIEQVISTDLNAAS